MPYFLMIMLAYLLIPGSLYAKNIDDENVFIKIELSDSKIFDGEWARYDVVLYSSTSTILDVLIKKNPGFENFWIIEGVPDSNFHETKIKGRPYYRAILKSYYLSGKSVGNFEISAPVYDVITGKHVIEKDPFWGSYRRTVKNNIQVVGQAEKVRIEKLPKDYVKGMAIGDYKVNVWIPSGNVEPNEDSILIVSIEGKGDLSDAVIPAVTGNFTGPLRLKSIKEDRKRYLDRDALCSEIILECKFTSSEEGDVEFPGVSYQFFNPEKGKFETAVSDPLIINVRRSALPTKPKSIYGI